MTENNEPEKQLTVQEVADLCSCCASTIYRDAKSKLLKSHKLGKSGYRFSWREHVLPYLKRSEEEKKPRPQRPSGKKATLKHLTP